MCKYHSHIPVEGYNIANFSVLLLATSCVGIANPTCNGTYRQYSQTVFKTVTPDTYLNSYLVKHWVDLLSVLRKSLSDICLIASTSSLSSPSNYTRKKSKEYLCWTFLYWKQTTANFTWRIEYCDMNECLWFGFSHFVQTPQNILWVLYEH